MKVTDGERDILRELEADADPGPPACNLCGDTGTAYEEHGTDGIRTVPCPFGCRLEELQDGQAKETKWTATSG